MFQAIRRLFCNHRVLHVIRYHASVVPHAWVPKLLYVDKHCVHNFIQCVHCQKVFHTQQLERLYDTK